MAAARPSPLGVVSSRPVVRMAAAAVAVMAAIPMVMAEVGSEVTLVVPPPIVVEGERRETGLPASLNEEAHDSPAWSELKVSGGTTARLEVVHPPVSHRVLAVAIPPSRELVIIRSLHDTIMARSSSRSGVTCELVWPCPDEPGKAWFVHHDEEEVKL